MAFLGELFAIGNMIFSGIATVIVKSQGKELKPAALLLIQAFVSSISFIIIAAAMGDFLEMFKINWIALLPLVVAALFGIVLGNFMYFTSLQLIGVSKAYPIAMTYPLLTYIFEVIFFPDTNFIALKLVGILVVIIGVIFISLSHVNNPVEETPIEEISTDNQDNTHNIPLVVVKDLDAENELSGIKVDRMSIEENLKRKMIFGIILSALAAVTWASGTILIKFGLQNTDVEVIPINAARMFFLIPVSIPIFFLMNKGENKSKFTWKSVSLVAIASLLTLVASNILYLLAIDLIGASTPAAIAASGPLVATPLSILFLKEKVDWKIILGTLFTIGGIIMVIFLG